MSACVYCEKDKGKRSCPALGGLISAKCCGQHRGIEIDCPVTCHYYREGEEHIRARLAPDFHQSWLKAVAPLYHERRAQLLDWVITLEITTYSYFSQYSRGTDEDPIEALTYLKNKLSPIAIIESPGNALGKHLVNRTKAFFESGQGIDADEGQEGIELLLGVINAQLSEESPRHALHGLLGHVEQVIGVPENLDEHNEDDRPAKSNIILPGGGN